MSSQEPVNRKFAEDISALKVGVLAVEMEQRKQSDKVEKLESTLSELGHEVKMMRWAMYAIAAAVASNSPMFDKLLSRITGAF